MDPTKIDVADIYVFCDSVCLDDFLGANFLSRDRHESSLVGGNLGRDL